MFLHRPRVKAKKHRFRSRRALAEVAAFIIAHDRRAAGLHTEEAARSSSDVKQLFTRGVLKRILSVSSLHFLTLDLKLNYP